MNYAEIKKLDIANTEGVSCTVFFSGCKHNCKGCFNEVAQDFNYGKEWNESVEDEFIGYCKNKNVDNIAILGGEPFQQSYILLLKLLRRLKKEVDKPIWVWTGYTLEQLLSDEFSKEILTYIDVLIDGQFEEDKKDLMLKHRGSSNQRVINVQKSLKENKVILWEG